MNFTNVNGIKRQYEVVKGVSVIKGESILSEKYRPCELEDLILPKTLHARVNDWIERGEIDNFILFSTQGGSGKDSIINVIANKIPQIEIISINASLYRNISDMKEKLTSLVGRVGGFERRVIYLSEVGGLDKRAADSLKAFIEDNSHVSFMMTTNDLSNLSQPLQSRFNVYDLSSIPQDEKKELMIKTIKRLARILDIEGVSFDPEDLKMYILDKFPSHRNIVLDLKMNIMDGKFSYSSVTDNSLFTKFLKATQLKDGNALVKISTQIDAVDFLRWLNVNKLRIIPMDKMGDAIFGMSELQNQISANVPFKDVSLANFGFEMMGTKFNLEKDK